MIMSVCQLIIKEYSIYPLQDSFIIFFPVFNQMERSGYEHEKTLHFLRHMRYVTWWMKVDRMINVKLFFACHERLRNINDKKLSFPVQREFLYD